MAEPRLPVLRLLRARREHGIQIPPTDWEQIVAPAFDHAGYYEVTLTPRSGYQGRDLIAARRGVGSVRIIGSVEAYASDSRAG